MKSNTLETALEKVSRVITDRYGLRLVCEGDSCRTNGKVIYLPSLPDDLPEELLGAIRGWADHECAHAIFTQTKLGPKFQEKHGQRAFAILNVLEDARVERRMSRRYPGSRLNLEEGFRFVSKKMIRKSVSDSFRQFVSALYTRASGRPDQPWVGTGAYELAEEFQPELSRLPSCRSTSQVAKLAESIWEKLKEQFGQDASESGLPETAEEGGEQPESSQRGGQASPPADPGEPNEVMDSEQSDGEPANLQQAEDFSPMEQLRAEIEGELQTYSEGGHGTYRVYTREYDLMEVPNRKRDFDYRTEMEKLRPYVAGLRRRLLQTMMGREKTYWLRDRTRGSLDPRSLHRLATGTSSRIFRQRRQQKGGNTACTLLLDVSASMRGTALELCRQLALIFEEVLDKLHFPTEIIGFSTEDKDLRYQISQQTGLSEEELAKRYTRIVPLHHAIYKQFHEPWRLAAPRLETLASKSLTPLGESLLFAAKRLALRPEKRKVLFCLTDGKPVVGAWDEQITFDHACEAVRRISAASIEPVAIGIMEQCVADIFPRHAVIHSLQELPKSFLKQLCEVLSGR